MTLIVARNSTNVREISGDTKLTVSVRNRPNSSGSQKNTIPGVLKLFILNAELCLGFSGAHEIGLMTLRKLSAANAFDDVDRVKEILSSCHSESYQNIDSQTDFMLFRRSTTLTSLWRNGGYLETHEDCYIGNQAAYNKLATGSDSYSIVSAAVESSEYEDIAGVIMSVSDNGASLVYVTNAILYLPDELSHSYISTLVCPKEPKPYLGIYFHGADFGYLYDPLNEDFPTKVDATTLDLFRTSIGLSVENSVAMLPDGTVDS